MRVYRFRADCSVDVDRFHAALAEEVPDAVVSDMVVQPTTAGAFDAHVEAEWTVHHVDLATLVRIAESLEGCECIAETIQPVDRFTGDRDPHRPELPAQ